MKARQSGMYTCVKENVPRRQETESLMTIWFYRIRREHWMEKYGIRILRGSQSMMRRISSKYLVMWQVIKEVCRWTSVRSEKQKRVNTIRRIICRLLRRVWTVCMKSCSDLSVEFPTRGCVSCWNIILWKMRSLSACLKDILRQKQFITDLQEDFWSIR